MSEDRKIRTIQNLIAKAEATENESEKQAFYAKAEDLMAKYAIEEAELDLAREAAQRSKPETTQISVIRAKSPVADQMSNLAQALANQFRCKIVFYGLNQPKWTGNISATVVGFPSDLRFFEMMWTSLQLHLLSGLESKPDASASVGENVAKLHESGVTWRRVVEILSPETDVTDEPAMKRAASRFKGAYRTYCQKENRPQVGMVSPITWQRNFAAAYVYRIRVRFWDLEKDRPASSALALRTEEVEDKFNEMFGDLKSTKSKTFRTDYAARKAGVARANEADITGQKSAGGSAPAGELS